MARIVPIRPGVKPGAWQSGREASRKLTRFLVIAAVLWTAFIFGGLATCARLDVGSIPHSEARP